MTQIEAKHQIVKAKPPQHSIDAAVDLIELLLQVKDQRLRVEILFAAGVTNELFDYAVEEIEKTFSPKKGPRLVP